MRVCEANGAERSGKAALTLSDVFRAAERESTAHASEIVRGLLVSGRIRFTNPDIQRDLDVLSEQLHGAA